VQTVYSIEASNVKHQKFRCLAIGEGENGTYSITGVQHVDGIYNVVESENALLQFADITLFDEAPLAPVDLTFTAAEVVKDRNTTIRLTASWSRGSSITSVSFFVKYKIGDGNFVESTTTNTSFDIENVPPGTLVTFKVRGVGPAPRNKRSVVATTQIKVPRPTRKCPNPKNVTIDADGKGKATLRWQIDFTGVE
jgi:predicted phage tail protein